MPRKGRKFWARRRRSRKRSAALPSGARPTREKLGVAAARDEHVAVRKKRDRVFPVARSIEPAGLKVPLPGSYNSAVRSPPPAVSGSEPPAIRTRPSARSVAIGPYRATAIEPVGVKVPLFGSYSSADFLPK